MPTQLIAVLCEGPHDVAFLNRILKADGYQQEEKITLGKYPAPMSQLLIQQAQASNVGDLNLQEVRRRLLPAHVLKKGDIFLFLFSLGGDGKQADRIELLNRFRQFVPSPNRIRIPGAADDNQYSVLYFFDADDQGVEPRRAAINREVTTALGVSEQDGFQSPGEVKIINGLQVGCYVFSELGSDQGKLENVLVPLMQKNNEAIFQAADDFLQKYHEEDRLKKLKFRVQADGTVIEKRDKKHKYDHKKSLIGTAGQLQLSGLSNQVYIGQSDYLTLSKILSDSQCQEIIAFFQKAVS